jgi:hypothetical protein
MTASAAPSICHELDAQDAARRYHQAGGYHQPATTNPTTWTQAMQQQLFRAIAYRLQLANTPPADSWPDMTVFWEAPSRDEALSVMTSMLALAWGCRPQDIDFYNLASEPELHAGCGFGDFRDMGDAALLCNGWSHGPLFCRADRTLMLVSPPMLARLQAARRLAHPMHLQQRLQAQAAADLAAREAPSRMQRMRERAEGAHATGFGSL